MVSEVKAKKMETMKGIKRLQVQKESLSKKQKQAKADYDKASSKICWLQILHVNAAWDIDNSFAVVSVIVGFRNR